MTTESRDVLLEVDLPHSPEKVWRAITEADLVAEWLMASGLRPEVGSRFQVPSADPRSRTPAVECEVTEAIPNCKLQWRQRERETEQGSCAVESTVTLQLLPTSTGTQLRIVHEGFRQVSIAAKVVALADRRQRRLARAPKITCALAAHRLAA
jgi:uncharacterized protein YndB with AHSA1/START domain